MPEPSVEHAEVRPGVELAYWHARPATGQGFPLLLVHGWPETKRIWIRNVEPLAAAGFEVIVPDLRGFGDSGLAPDGHYDLAAHARDLHALVHDVLGHERCVASGGDLGGGVIQDLGLRFEGFVARQVLFNSILPLLPEEYAAAGLETRPGVVTRMAADYFVRQGRDADGLAAVYDTPDKRRRYVAEFYGHRFWATPGAFAPDDVDYMTEPFADAEKLRAGWGNYESAQGARPLSEAPRFFERSDVETLALHGPDDHVIWRQFPEMCEVAFTHLVGPFVVPRAGHFLQWERADLLNATLTAFLRDLQGYRYARATMAEPREGATQRAAERIAAIVDAAEQAADDLRTKAEHRANERIAEAQRAADNRVAAAETEAREILAAAREDAATLRTSAQADAQRMLEEARSERLQLEAAAADVRAVAEQDAARIREAAEEVASETRRAAQDDARGLVSQARSITREVLADGSELSDELHQLSDSLRSNAELLLRDVRLAHARMTAQVDQAAGGERRSDDPGGDFDIPEFMPRR